MMLPTAGVDTVYAGVTLAVVDVPVLNASGSNCYRKSGRMSRARRCQPIKSHSHFRMKGVVYNANELPLLLQSSERIAE